MCGRTQARACRSILSSLAHPLVHPSFPNVDKKERRGSVSSVEDDDDDGGDDDEEESGLATKLKVITSFFQLSSTVVSQYKVRTTNECRT